MKRQKLGRSFKLQCFGVKYDYKDLPTFNYTMDCCQFLEMKFTHVGHHDGLLETFIKADAFPPLVKDILDHFGVCQEECKGRLHHNWCLLGLGEAQVGCCCLVCPGALTAHGIPMRD